MEHQQYIILMGNPKDGFRAIGPFASKGFALDYLRADPSSGLDMCLMPLDAPAEGESDAD